MSQTKNPEKVEFWTLPRYAAHHGFQEYQTSAMAADGRLTVAQYSRWYVVAVHPEGHAQCGRSVDFDFANFITATQAAELTGYGAQWFRKLRLAGRLDAYPVFNIDGTVNMWLFDKTTIANPRQIEREPRQALARAK